MSKLFEMPFADVYPHYINKVKRKGGSVENLHVVITWLTGFDNVEIQKHLTERTTFREFFSKAAMNENAVLITGRICGVKLEEIEDPLMKKIRYLDKLVDEVANQRPLEKILRTK